MIEARGNRILIAILEKSSYLTHLIISIALMIATILITLYFFKQLYEAIESHTLIDGFLHALATLLLLWTISELIVTEIRFLRGEDVNFAVFVEVALVVMVREIIMLPMENTHPDMVEVGIWVGAATFLGLTYYLIRAGQRQYKISETTVSKQTPIGLPTIDTHNPSSE